MGQQREALPGRGRVLRIAARAAAHGCAHVVGAHARVSMRVLSYLHAQVDCDASAQLCRDVQGSAVHAAEHDLVL